MPVFIAAIAGAILSLVGSIVGRVLVALGVGVVTYKGLGVTLDWLKAQVIEALFGLPVEVFALLGYMKVGTCINIITSALLVRLLLNGLSSDTVKEWVLQ